MKTKIKFRIPAWQSVIRVWACCYLVILASCSSDGLPGSDSSDPHLPGSDPNEIRLFSGISEITTQTRGQGVINSTLATDLPISILRVDQQESNSSYPLNYTGLSALSATIKKDAGNLIVFDTKQYYLPNSNLKTTLYGWYPATGSTWNATNGKLAFQAIDGSTDILVAKGVEGRRKDQFSTSKYLVTFRHVLTKVEVYVKLGHADYAKYWGDISAINFIGKKQTCTLTFPSSPGGSSGSITPGFTGNDKLPIVSDKIAPPSATYTLTTDAALVGYAMFAPHADDQQSLQVEVVTSEGGTHTATVVYADAALGAGENYELTLTFTATEIQPHATITAWETKGTPTAMLGND